MFCKTTIFLLSLALSCQALAFDHTHGAWTAFLKKNLVVKQGGSVSQVKYKTLDASELKRYTGSLLKVSQVEVNGWSKNQQLAFYFNLYNALTVQRIKEKYPIDSIQNIASRWERLKGQTTWKIPFFKLFGKDGYLDRIEHEIVRKSGRFSEPRVHFAFNCASVGCPALLGEAFTADKLDAQLEKSLVAFLSDKTRNRFKDGRLEVSKIFYWYKEDFTKGWGGFSSLEEFFAKYANIVAKNPKEIAIIKSKKVTFNFLDYNWNLNEAK